MSPVDIFPRKPGQKPGEWHGRELPPHWPDVFLEAIDTAYPRLVHIQHGLYIGHGRKLAYFVSELRARRIPCVMTLHGVWPPTFFRRWPARFYHLLAEYVEQVIVHQRDGTLMFLQDHGIPTSRIAVIPHGTWTSEDIVPAEIPGMKDMAGRRIVLFAGHIFRRKGLHIVLKSFPDVVEKIPDACLLVVGNERTNNLLDRLYRLWLHARMRPGLKEGWLIRRPEYVPDEELWSGIIAAEVAVFPYLRHYGSASGVFHRVLAAGRPAICSNVPTFAEAIEAWGENLSDLFPPAGDTKAWCRALVNILSDESFRQKALEASTILGRDTSWPLVARQHLRLYASMLSPVPFPGEK